MQALAKTAARPRLWLVTQGVQAVSAGQPVPGLAQAPLWGLGRVLALEHPELWAGLVDLDSRTEPGQASRWLLEELGRGEGEDQVAWRSGVRHVARLARGPKVADEVAPLRLRAEGTYLVTGGQGGLGGPLLRYLVQAGAREIVVVSRRGESPQAEALRGEMKELGARLHVRRADVSRAEELAPIVQEIRTTLPPLRGVLHLAGVLDDGLLVNQTWERFAAVMAPKVLGAWNLHCATIGAPLDFFILFSSAVSLLGPPGQASHAAANVFLDALAHMRQSQGLPATSVNWGAWAEVGSVVGRNVGAYLARRGIDTMSPRNALAALERVVARKCTQTAVMSVTWRRFAEHFPSGAGPSLFRDICAADPTMSAPEGATGFLSRLLDAPSNQRRELLDSHIRNLTIHVLGLDPDGDFDPRRPLQELGLDSLLALQLRRQLGSGLERWLPATLLFNYPTVEALSDYLAGEVLDLRQPGPTRPDRAPLDVDRTVHLNELEALPEGELEKLLVQRLDRIKQR